jgi:hypothetical protein
MTSSTLFETAVRPTGENVCRHVKTGVGMLVGGAALAYYLSRFGGDAAGKFCLLAAAALLLGSAIGCIMGRLADVLFWTAIGVAYGCLAVVHADMYHWTAEYAWPLVGGMVGAAAAVAFEGKVIRRMACCALVALSLVAVYEFAFFRFQWDLMPDLCCATLGGALMGAGVELVGRFERAAAIPRYVLAVGLLGAGIAGHWFAIHHIPGL